MATSSTPCCLVEKWRERVDRREEARAVMKILDILGLDVYRDGEALPDKRIWIHREPPIEDPGRGRRPCPPGHANDVGEIRP